MSPNPAALPFLLSVVFLASPARSATPQAAAVPAPASSEALQSGAEALPPAPVPAPRLMRSAEARARLGPERDAAAEDDVTSDSPEVAAEIEAESAELEDIRKAEESSHVRDTPEVRAGASLDGLGLESPIRDHLEGALSREEMPPAGEAGRIELLPEIDHDLATLQAEYDIPLDVNPAVVAYIRFFQSPGVRPHFVKWLGRSYRYMDRYRKIMKEEGLPEDTVYLAMIESGFGNFAYSRARASGPWQFIAGTGRLFGLRQDFWVDERRDPERSARAAARLLKRLYEQTGDWRLAWAAYNAGAGRVLSAQRKGFDDFWSMAATKGRRVLRPETKGYVPKLMAAAIIAKHPEAFGFKGEEIERQAWVDYAEVEIPSATLLSVIARAAGVPERDLIELNPELRRTLTPPRSYELKIPVDAAPAFAEAWPAVNAKVRTTFAGHVIRKGDTLSRIAALYGVPVEGIVEMNNLRDGRRLRVGSELLIPRPLGGGASAPASEDEPRPAAVVPRPRPAPTVDAARAAPRSDRTVHRVRAGDTLWSISQRYGVELADLCRWNGIKRPHHYKLQSGARLVVYTEGG